MNRKEKQYRKSLYSKIIQKYVISKIELKVIVVLLYN